jgi:RNA polymerase sigma factor (sigma-70 family)
MLERAKYSEEELILSLQNRRESAFDYLYDHYSGALYGTILSMIKDTELANDLLQEVFIKIWKQIDSYDPTKGRLFTWMVNIARHGAIDFLRSKEFKNNAKNQPLSNFVYDTVSDTKPSEDYIGLHQIVNQLKEEFRTLIEYAYFKGYTHEEIAGELNLPIGTVKTRLRAALVQLRKLMKLIIALLLLWI